MSQHAPVVLFVYNRPKHTERTLETLRLCRMASESELYVFADGPKHDADSDDMLKIKRTRELVQGATGFANVHMVTREKNLGLYQSVVRGVGEVPIVPPIPAIANAIHDATGIRMRKLPMSPPNVLAELMRAGGGH